jgi:hypothetical protein
MTKALKDNLPHIAHVQPNSDVVAGLSAGQRKSRLPRLDSYACFSVRAALSQP